MTTRQTDTLRPPYHPTSRVRAALATDGGLFMLQLALFLPFVGVLAGVLTVVS